MSFKHLVFWCFCACLIGCSDSPNSGVARFYLGDTTCVSLKTSLPAEGEDLIVYNASERVVLNNVDNEVFSVPIYDGSLVGKWNSDGDFCGTWIDSLRPNNYSVALEITPVVSEPPCNEERVKTVYETSLGLLVTEVFCDSVVGTFLTPTGDYRYLNGTISNKSLVLNTFDGAHLFYFSATISGDSLTNGVFKSGVYYEESWAGFKTDSLIPGWSSHQPYNNDRVFEFKATALNGKEVINTNYTIVNSVLVATSERPEIKIDWRIYTKNPDSPLIRDLIIEGLSLARTQKEEFSSILNSNDGDIKALFKTLEKFSNNS